MTPSPPSWPCWRWAITGLTIGALALSTYLAWHSLLRGSVLGCGGGSACDKVLSTRWSSIAGILPVSGLAAGVYLAMLVASLSIGYKSAAPVRRLAWRVMLVLTGAAAGSAVWFTIVQKWVIDTFCPYCIAAHVTGLLLAALVIWRALRQPVPDAAHLPRTSPAVASSAVIRDLSTRRCGPEIRRWPALALVVLGLGLSGILAGSQAIFAPPAVFVAGKSQNTSPAVEPQSMPLLGSADAPYVVNLLFDYKCPHCQELHFLLDEVVRRYGGRLAFALCPTPLDRQCNRYIPQDVEEFKHSCELAKVALAVWLANRERFAGFDQWMFSYDSGDRWHPRSVEAARAKAIELIGEEKFNFALSDSSIDRLMQASIALYGDTIQSGNGAIPKLVCGSRWVIPQPHSADDLVLILQNSLALPKP